METQKKAGEQNSTESIGVTEMQEGLSKDEFKRYVEVQRSGVTNMWNVTLVCELSGLTKNQVMYIMKHYSEIEQHFKEAEN